jgi:hypothetical protein
LLALSFALASLAHRIELFHDELTLAFADLAEATTEVERRASQRINIREGNGQVKQPARMSEQALIQSTEFFDDAWILKMTVAFVGKEQASAENTVVCANRFSHWLALARRHRQDAAHYH